MDNFEVKFKREELNLYKREVEAREKQAAALEKIARLLEPKAIFTTDVEKLGKHLGDIHETTND